MSNRVVALLCAFAMGCAPGKKLAEYDLATKSNELKRQVIPWYVQDHRYGTELFKIGPYYASSYRGAVIPVFGQTEVTPDDFILITDEGKYEPVLVRFSEDGSLALQDPNRDAENAVLVLFLVVFAVGIVAIIASKGDLKFSVPKIPKVKVTPPRWSNIPSFNVKSINLPDRVSVSFSTLRIPAPRLGPVHLTPAPNLPKFNLPTTSYSPRFSGFDAIDRIELASNPDGANLAQQISEAGGVVVAETLVKPSELEATGFAFLVFEDVEGNNPVLHTLH